jgi:hypothetical protein
VNGTPSQNRYPETAPVPAQAGMPAPGYTPPPPPVSVPPPGYTSAPTATPTAAGHPLPPGTLADTGEYPGTVTR